MSLANDIKRTRFHDFTVRLGPRSGAPGNTPRSSHRARRVRQVRHDFSFGSALFPLVRKPGTEVDPEFAREITSVWNFATLPFYWGRYEPVEGRPMEDETKEGARWALAHRMTTKGHPLCWHTVCADWLLEYDNDTILAKQLDRIQRDVSRFAGLIDVWDVINEVVIMPIFDKYDNAVTRIANHIGPVELTLKCFNAAREANPNATLLINDFNLSPDYERLIDELLMRGCPIDAIGLQSHQHQGYHGVEYTMDVIDRFARFRKPLHFTEATILSGHPVPPEITDLNDYQIAEWPSTPELEDRQARQVQEYYETIFSRPETAALIWWSMTDGGWLGAPAGLLRKDLSRKPAFDRIESLIKGAWWFNEQTVLPAADGALRFTGTAGTYQVEAGGSWIDVSLSAETPSAMLADG